MKDFSDIKTKFKELEEKLINPEIISDTAQLTKISKEHANLKKSHDLILKLEKLEENIKGNKEVIDSENDPELKKMASEELQQLETEKTN